MNRRFFNRMLAALPLFSITPNMCFGDKVGFLSNYGNSIQK